MANGKTKKQKEETTVKEKKQSKKLSEIGQWMRKHPHGLDGVVINDRRILYGLS
jgi:hypothetical protein